MPWSSPARTSSSSGRATQRRTSAPSATSTGHGRSPAPHGADPWATTGRTRGPRCRSSPTSTVRPSTSWMARRRTWTPSSSAPDTSTTSRSCPTTYDSRPRTGSGRPGSTRAWRGRRTPGSSTWVCRTSTTPSTCSTRKPGGPAM